MDYQSVILRYLRRCESEGLSPATHDFYRRQLTYYGAWLQGRPWDDPDSIESYMSHLGARVQRGEIQPETMGAAFRTLRSLFNWLVQRGDLLPGSPMAKLAPPKQPRKIPRRISIDEYKRLLRSIPQSTWLDQRDRLIISLLFWCGLRVSALVGLDVSDVDAIAGILTVRSDKGGDPHFVPLLPVVKMAFISYLYTRPATATGILLPGADGHGTPTDRSITDSGVRQMLERRCQAAGIPYRNPHSFRHGIAMHLLNELGADMSFVSEILGHRDERTTKAFYAQWLTKGLASQYERLVRNGGEM